MKTHFCIFAGRIVLVLALVSGRVSMGLAQVSACTEKLLDASATFMDGALTLETSKVARKYLWNEGQLISVSLTDKTTGYVWDFGNTQTPDFQIPDSKQQPRGGKIQLRIEPGSDTRVAHLVAQVYTQVGDLEIKRIFRIYPGCPAIACDYYLRGKSETNWHTSVANSGDLKNVEDRNAFKNGKAQTIITETVKLSGKHWETTAIQFFDITDLNNNLVKVNKESAYIYQRQQKGNLLFVDHHIKDQGLFILKEAPSSNVQIAYPGFDFLTQTSEINAAGIGMQPCDLRSDEWTRGYGFVTGVTSGGELGRLRALRDYQRNVRKYIPQRDDMIMSNTWGDRNTDTKLNEAFAFEEIRFGKKLGVTRFQLDAGWSQDYQQWETHRERFPNGLLPVVQEAKRNGIELCLWFEPQKKNYTLWRQDATVLINLYKTYGVSTFKIDGVQIDNKESEVNFRKLLDSVYTATNGKVFYNLDVTAGRRNGYHYFNEYGNLFLENRYTDWGNYYPHRTLRNLWMLSKYVPAQMLQVEFLNNERNKDQYPGDDVLSPGSVPFDYAFAVSMMAQPLAWMEVSQLSPKAFGAAHAIKKYLSIQHDLHKGHILPIGQEPSGLGWTGFQSIQEGKGYLLIFRENNKQNSAKISTWLNKGQKITLKPVVGDGKGFKATVGSDGQITFTLMHPNSYVLYQYTIR